MTNVKNLASTMSSVIKGEGHTTLDKDNIRYKSDNVSGDRNTAGTSAQTEAPSNTSPVTTINFNDTGMAYPVILRELAIESVPSESEEKIKHISDLLKKRREACGKVNDNSEGFPAVICVGGIVYPVSLFSSWPCFRRIIETFGITGTDQNVNFVEFPLCADLRRCTNIFLSCGQQISADIAAFTHHVMWSFLSFIPIRKLNICVFDCEERGNSIQPFLEFRKSCPELFDKKIYTSQEDITEKLRELNARIDEFVQNKLSGRFKNIRLLSGKSGLEFSGNRIYSTVILTRASIQV